MHIKAYPFLLLTLIAEVILIAQGKFGEAFGIAAVSYGIVDVIDRLPRPKPPGEKEE